MNLYEVPETLKNCSKQFLVCQKFPEIFSILEKGFEERKKNVIERGVQRGNKAINVVIVDYYKLIHAGEFTLSKKFKI